MTQAPPLQTMQHPMKTKSIFHVVTILAFAAFLQASFAAAKPEAEAQKAAEQWLAVVDAGKFAESWKTAAAYFQAAVPQEQWERSLTAARKPLGDLTSRKLKSAHLTKSLPGAPDGQYVIMQFDASFAHKKDAVETVTAMLTKDDQWKVAGYYVK
jgi:hypothetical protein